MIRKHLISFFYSFVFVLSFNVNISSASGASDSILDKVQSNYKNIKTIAAVFNQDSHSEALGEDENSSGVFKAYIPNNIRVEYKQPRKQVYLVTEDGLTFVNDADMQVVKDKADSVLKSKVPLTFLAGVGDIRKDFKILKIYVEAKAYKFDLAPKDNGEIESMGLWVDKKSLLVNKIFVKELGGNTITFELTNIELNKGVSKDEFDIKIPNGYDLIDNR